MHFYFQKRKESDSLTQPADDFSGFFPRARHENPWLQQRTCFDIFYLITKIFRPVSWHFNIFVLVVIPGKREKNCHKRK